MEEKEQGIVPGCRHIVERPRLTRLLNQTPARVIMLVAPAGYGKTTLARQWLVNRPHAWYQGSSASADVAALGAGITEAAKNVTDDVGHRFREWVSTRRGDEDADLIASFLAEDLARWPADAWLAIDDYHYLTQEAEHVVDDLISAVPALRILITTRRRPLWATPRKLLYGEVSEVGRAALAMDQDEANAVLHQMDTPLARGLVALADGWPAIIGLASFAEAWSFLDQEQLPPALHDYVADELYASVRDAAREPLCQISLLPSPSVHLIEKLLGADGDLAVREGFRVGFLTPEGPERVTVHPLLRTFLRAKINELAKDRRDKCVEQAVWILLDQNDWEGTFDLISEFALPNLLEPLLQSSLYELLNDGRLATVAKFVTFGQENEVSVPVLDLAGAELAFRQGFHDRARILSQHAGEALATDNPLASKAFCRAGQSAYFSDDACAAIALFAKARDLAQDTNDEQAAIWGHFTAAVELEDKMAIDLLQEFERVSGVTSDDAARVANGRLHFALRLGRLSDALSRSEAVASLIPDARDPVVRASFWHVYAAALRVAGLYREAIRAADEALAEVERFHLTFARPHVLLTRAGIHLGLGQPKEALPLLNEVAALAQQRGDVYLQMNECTVRCRLHLLEGDAVTAARVTEGYWPHVPSNGQYAELLACRAIAVSGIRTSDEPPESLITRAEETSEENEASSLCVWARAILSTRQHDPEASSLIEAGVRRASISGVLDPLVFAHRIEPTLFTNVSDSEVRSSLEQVLRRVDGENQPVREHGLDRDIFQDVIVGLTNRERQVLALLAESKTNKEIASDLFLSEATVKVHVRHILRKLGARTRTEAAIRAIKMQ